MELKVDKKEDIVLYHKYLLDDFFVQKYPFVQKKIRTIFPQFKDLEKNEDSEQMIELFIDQLYQQHQKEIKQIGKNIQYVFKKYEDSIIEALLKSMDYPGEKIREYSIFLSLFPFSTFGTKHARISLLDALGPQKKEIHCLDLFIHEISHVIVKEYFIKNTIIENQLVFDCMKELLAPILMRSPYFESLPLSQQSKLANPEYEYLYLHEEKLIDNLEKKYKLKKQEMSFECFLLECYNFLKQFEISLQQKKEIFNQLYSGGDMRDPNFLKKLQKAGYCNPL